MAKFVHSKFLFTNEDGTQMHFYMAPCSERHKLKPYIEHGGGVLSIKSSDDEDVIKLAPPGTKVHSEGYVKSSYIMECVEQNRILNLDNYRLTVGDFYDSDDNESLFDEAGHPCIIKGQAKDKCGRRKYFLADDMKIIRYLLDERAADEVRGNQIWKTMEVLKITPHTWQSMRDRYLKTILPHINTYTLTAQEKSMLTGNMAELRKDGLLQADSSSDWEKSPHRHLSPRKQSPTKCSKEEATCSRRDVLLDKGDRRNGLKSSVACQASENKMVNTCLDDSPELFKSASENFAQIPEESLATSLRKNSIDSDDPIEVNRGISKRHKHRLVNGEDDANENQVEEEEEEDPTIMQQIKQDASSNNNKYGKNCRTRRRTHQVQALEAVEKWLDLSRTEMIDALYRVNGELDNALHWIFYGTQQNGKPVWNDAADKLVMMTPSEASESLFETYTACEIKRRKLFILQNAK